MWVVNAKIFAENIKFKHLNTPEYNEYLQYLAKQRFITEKYFEFFERNKIIFIDVDFIKN